MKNNVDHLLNEEYLHTNFKVQVHFPFLSCLQAITYTQIHMAHSLLTLNALQGTADSSP